MAFVGIVAIARNNAIGKDGKLPWHYPADLKFFKETTTGNTVVMGANTWRSIGRPLPNRLNVVLTRFGNVEVPDGVVKLGSKNEVVELSKHRDGDIFIIGGAQVFAEFADVIDKWFVTTVPDEVENADVFIPRDFLDGFELEEIRDLGEDLQVRILRRK